MPYCPNCGAEVDAADRFCQGCGTEIQPDSEPVTDGVQRQPPTGQRRESTTREQPQRPRVEQTAGFSVGQKIVFVGAAIVGLGAFLPWMSAEALGASVSKQGIEGDGVLTLIGGVIAAAGGFFRWGRWAKVSVGAIGSLIALLALIYISDPLAFSGITNPTAQAVVDPAIGLYATAIGGVMIVAGPIWDYVQ